MLTVRIIQIFSTIYSYKLSVFLLENHKRERGILSISLYYLYFLIRRITLVACFFLLKECPKAQTIAASILQKFYLVSRCRPFKGKSANIFNIIIEISITSTYSLYVFYEFDKSEPGKVILMWGIIGNVMLCFATNTISVLYYTLQYHSYLLRSEAIKLRLRPKH